MKTKERVLESAYDTYKRLCLEGMTHHEALADLAEYMHITQVARLMDYIDKKIALEKEGA